MIVIHRLLYMLAGLLVTLGTFAVSTKPESAVLFLLNSLIAFVFAYIKEMKFHIRILKHHLANQQKPPS